MNFLTEIEFEALRLSLKVALCSVVVSLPLALFVGYKMARCTFPGKAIVESAIHLPLVMPPVTTGYLLLLVLGMRSPIGLWFYEELGVRISFSFYAAVIASIVVSFPLMVRSIRSAMQMVDVGLEEASYILGFGKLATFFKVTMPLAMPGIVSGLVLAFARSLGEFGATISFAGNIQGETQTLPLAIYSFMQTPGNEMATLRLVVISVVISFFAMLFSEWLIKRLKND